MVEIVAQQKDLEPDSISLGFIMLKPLGTTEPFRTEILKQISIVATIETIRPHVITQEEAQLYMVQVDIMKMASQDHTFMQSLTI